MPKQDTMKQEFVPPTSPDMARENVMNEGNFKKSFLIPIATTAKKLRVLIQDAAMQSLLRAFAHDNYDYINSLFTTVEQNMSKTNAKQLRVWFETYSPAQLRKVGDEGHTFRKDTREEAKAFDFQSAYDNPWYEIETYTEQEIADMFSFSKLSTSVENLIKKAEKAVEAGTIEANEVAQVTDLVSRLKQVVASPITVKQIDRHLPDTIDVIPAPDATLTATLEDIVNEGDNTELEADLVDNEAQEEEKQEAA